MASFAYNTSSLRSQTARPVPSNPRPKAKKASGSPQGTVFDLLYHEYLPFRLYADYMLGVPMADLATRFGLSEHWVAERIEAVRLCLGRQVRLNLLASAPQTRAIH